MQRLSFDCYLGFDGAGKPANISEQVKLKLPREHVTTNFQITDAGKTKNAPNLEAVLTPRAAERGHVQENVVLDTGRVLVGGATDDRANHTGQELVCDSRSTVLRLASSTSFAIATRSRTAFWCCLVRRSTNFMPSG